MRARNFADVASREARHQTRVVRALSAVRLPTEKGEGEE
jgi:hypothetical protein